jgi:DNA-binding MarR family transcriptional regulator
MNDKGSSAEKGIAIIDGHESEATFLRLGDRTRRRDFVPIKFAAFEKLLSFNLNGQTWRCLAALLNCYRPPHDKCAIYYPHIGSLSRSAGLHITTVYTQLRRLEALEIITIEASDVPGTTSYRRIVFAEWLVY